MIERHDHGSIAELRLARPPANALTPDLLERLHDELETALEEAEAEALVLSGRPGMFSAGLDVPHLLALDRDGIHDTFRRLLEVCRLLGTSPIPVAAAVTGHSPAGGAVLATFCDYRVMAEGPYRIGLNETRVGLPIPELLYGALRRLVGGRRAERLLVHGRLVEAREALDVGFVDELAPPEEVASRAVAWCESLLELPRSAVAGTRRACRAELHRLLAGEAFDDAVETLAAAWFREETQAALRALVARLEKKS